MADTLSILRARVKRKFSDIQNSVIDQCLNDAAHELADEFPLLISEASETCVVDDGEILLTPDTAVIFRVEHQVSATDRRILELLLWEDFERRFPRQREESSSRPAFAYVRSGNLYAWPPPDTATSGTYPRYWIVASKRLTDLVNTSDTLPESLPHHEAITARAKLKIAKDDYPSMVQELKMEVAETTRQLASWLNSRVADTPQRIDKPTFRESVT